MEGQWRKIKNYIKDFWNGDKKAFETIIDIHMEAVIYFINRFVKNVDIAEDLAQDVFVYVLINKKEYDFKYSLKTYLYTIGKCRAINYLKREKRIVSLAENMYQDENDIEEIVFKKEKNKNIRKAINKLSNEQSQAIFLVDIEELSYKEACKVMGTSMSSLKSLIHRARKNLKKILVKEEEKYDR